MPKLDHWTMRARVGRVERERPDLEHSIVRGLYKNYFEMREREPTFDEFREYVHEITSTIEWRDLYDWFSPHEPTIEEREGLLDGVAAGAPAVTLAPRRRRPGRPGWTPELFPARYRDACARSTPPHSFRSVAPNFDTLDGDRGIDPDHLRKLAHRFGLPPEQRSGDIGR